jgi:hypothetical protein
VIDDDFAVWRAFGNVHTGQRNTSPTPGTVRFHDFGEGEYERPEQVIRQLLEKARGPRG